MAQLGKSLRERARLANIGGTSRLRTHDLYKQKKAQNLLAGLASQVNPALDESGKTGWGGLNTILQLVAAGTGQAWAVPLLIAAEAAHKGVKRGEAGKDIKTKASDIESQLAKMGYGDYGTSNVTSILNQFNQALKSKGKVSMLGDLISLATAGLGSGSGKFLTKTGEKVTKEVVKKGTAKEAIKYFTDAGVEVAAEDVIPQTIFESLSKPVQKTLEGIPGLGTSLDLKKTSLTDLLYPKGGKEIPGITKTIQSKLFPKGGAGIDKTLTDMLNIIPGLKPRIKYSNPRMGITGTISPPWFPKVKSLGLENILGPQSKFLENLKLSDVYRTGHPLIEGLLGGKSTTPMIPTAPIPRRGTGRVI
tara:strand:- start:2461 stop:3546 length:1086 start_codon:yes stop_codon:yes gene_type:complete